MACQITHPRTGTPSIATTNDLRVRTTNHNNLETLHKYHCNNPGHRRCISMFGKVYDKTSGVRSNGSDGAYKEYAGHDITLVLSNHKMQEQWLDHFVEMKEKWVTDAKKWSGYMDVENWTSGTKTPRRGPSCRMKKWKPLKRDA